MAPLRTAWTSRPSSMAQLAAYTGRFPTPHKQLPGRGGITSQAISALRPDATARSPSRARHGDLPIREGPSEVSKKYLETGGFRPAGGHLLYAARARSESVSLFLPTGFIPPCRAPKNLRQSSLAPNPRAALMFSYCVLALAPTVPAASWNTEIDTEKRITYGEAFTARRTSLVAASCLVTVAMFLGTPASGAEPLVDPVELERLSDHSAFFDDTGSLLTNIWAGGHRGPGAPLALSAFFSRDSPLGVG